MTKEQAISHAQYLDLVYSQSNTLYDLITHAPRPTYDLSKPPQAHSDEIIGSVQERTSSRKTSTSSSTTKTFAKNTSTPTKTSYVNVVQTAQSKNPPSSRGKKSKKKKIPLTKKINNRKKNLLQITKERGELDSHACFEIHYNITPKIVHASKRYNSM